MELRESKIYSLNKLAWLDMHDVSIRYEQDDEGQSLGVVVVDEPTRDLLIEFKDDAEELHKFISSCGKVKNKLRESRGDFAWRDGKK